ncbi:MAG: hypothetical protein DRI37_03290 [Chloroflexi bacterium]|nr:MAG: hypothetical protein DRI37_03290 [Chloroflexota bacterium]
MRNGLRLHLGAMLILSLALAMGQSMAAQGEAGVGEQTPADIFVSSSPCAPSAPEQFIPDDGRWLQVCLLDPLAPEATIVTRRLAGD